MHRVRPLVASTTTGDVARATRISSAIAAGGEAGPQALAKEKARSELPTGPSFEEFYDPLRRFGAGTLLLNSHAKKEKGPIGVTDRARVEP